MPLVPSDSVYSRSAVRSSRAERKVSADSRLTATSSTTASARPAVEMRVRCISGRLLVFQHHQVGVQPEGDEAGEVDQVAQVDDAERDGVEVGEEAEGRDGVDQEAGRPG